MVRFRSPLTLALVLTAASVVLYLLYGPQYNQGGAPLVPKTSAPIANSVRAGPHWMQADNNVVKFWQGQGPNEGDDEDDVQGDVEDDVEGDVKDDADGDVEENVEDDVEDPEKDDFAYQPYKSQRFPSIVDAQQKRDAFFTREEGKDESRTTESQEHVPYKNIQPSLPDDYTLEDDNDYGEGPKEMSVTRRQDSVEYDPHAQPFRADVHEGLTNPIQDDPSDAKNNLPAAQTRGVALQNENAEEEEEDYEYSPGARIADVNLKVPSSKDDLQESQTRSVGDNQLDSEIRFPLQESRRKSVRNENTDEEKYEDLTRGKTEDTEEDQKHYSKDYEKLQESRRDYFQNTNNDAENHEEVQGEKNVAFKENRDLQISNQELQTQQAHANPDYPSDYAYENKFPLQENPKVSRMGDHDGKDSNGDFSTPRIKDSPAVHTLRDDQQERQRPAVGDNPSYFEIKPPPQDDHTIPLLQGNHLAALEEGNENPQALSGGLHKQHNIYPGELSTDSEGKFHQKDNQKDAREEGNKTAQTSEEGFHNTQMTPARVFQTDFEKESPRRQNPNAFSHIGPLVEEDNEAEPVEGTTTPDDDNDEVISQTYAQNDKEETEDDVTKDNSSPKPIDTTQSFTNALPSGRSYYSERVSHEAEDDRNEQDKDQKKVTEFDQTAGNHQQVSDVVSEATMAPNQTAVNDQSNSTQPMQNNPLFGTLSDAHREEHFLEGGSEQNLNPRQNVSLEVQNATLQINTTGYRDFKKSPSDRRPAKDTETLLQGLDYSPSQDTENISLTRADIGNTEKLPERRSREHGEGTQLPLQVPNDVNESTDSLQTFFLRADSKVSQRVGVPQTGGAGTLEHRNTALTDTLTKAPNNNQKIQPVPQDSNNTKVHSLDKGVLAELNSFRNPFLDRLMNKGDQFLQTNVSQASVQAFQRQHTPDLETSYRAESPGFDGTHALHALKSEDSVGENPSLKQPSDTSSASTNKLALWPKSFLFDQHLARNSSATTLSSTETHQQNATQKRVGNVTQTSQSDQHLAKHKVQFQPEKVSLRDKATLQDTVGGFQKLPADGNTKWYQGKTKSEGRVCISGRQSYNVFIPCNASEKMGPRVLPPESSVIETDNLPLKTNLMPEVSNGHLATVVQSNTIYMNGLYNGVNTSSHRARIPSTVAVFATVAYPTTTVTGKYRLDLGRGVFSEVYTGDGFTVEVRRYAHRELTRLLVTEVLVNRTTSTLPIVLSFFVNTGPSSTDIFFTQERPGLWNGKTKQAENARQASTIPVTVVYTVVPPVVTFAPSTMGSVTFLTSVSPSRAEALDYYNEGLKRIGQGTLFSSHVNRWDTLWLQGRLDLTGNVTMATSTYAAQYYLLGALPLKADTTWPFVGMAPGGLAHGALLTDYEGHIFWDQDTWMFPGIALLHADLGRIIVDTRIRTLNAAKTNAKLAGLQGAWYPTESAVTGLDVCPSNVTAVYEIHGNADVSWMMRQYLQLTNDTQFLSSGRGYEAIAAIADFWVSRSVYNETKKAFEIRTVMGPDEFHWPVNNSVYTNANAVDSLRTAQFAARLLKQPPKTQWENVASNMFISYEPVFNYHPEFDNYMRGSKVKQADVILMGFPHKWNTTDPVYFNDLTYYSSVTPGGPAMTWAIFAIGWLRQGRKDKADDAFYRGTWNIQQPFKVWSENADGGGAYNFHTGMGGYLQSLLYGYLGVDLNDDHLDMTPQLPPSLTGVAVRGLDYMGSSLDIVYDERQMNVTLVKAGKPLRLTLMKQMKSFDLVLGSPVVAGVQPVRIAPGR